MLELKDFFYFVQIIERGGFAAASRGLNVPKSTLSHRIQQIETSLGVRLINRTSRQFSPTDAGNEFYRHATSVLQQAEAAETAVLHRLAEPSGTIRITAAAATIQFAMREMIADFIIRFPKVNVVQHATDRYVDIVGESYDLAVRAHSSPLPNSTLVRKVLAPAPWFLFASPGYLDRAGTPQTPGELAHHSSLFSIRRGMTPVWPLRHPAKGDVSILIEPRLVSDDMMLLKQSAQVGLGIVALPGYVCRAELKTGELRRVLPDWSADDSILTALIPFRRGMLPAVRAFVDFISAEFPKVMAL